MTDYNPPHRLMVASGIIIAAIIAIIPFHAFLSVWAASLVGHYLAIRLWKELLLLALMLMAAFVLIKDARLRKVVFTSRLVQLITAYTAVQLIWGVVAVTNGQVTMKALAYGVLVNLRFLAFFGAVWVLAGHAKQLDRRWQKVVFVPAMLVILIGLLQYFVLPYDVLRHFGYSESTIYPYETINHNIDYLRIMSTLRGANPLGAYLVLVLGLIVVVWRRHIRVWQFVILPAAAVLVLILTFSRAAWLGLLVSIGVFVLTQLRTKRQWLITGGVTIILLLLATGTVVTLRHDETFQNVFTHTQSQSAVRTSSNEGHRSALQTGLRDLVHEPLGRGPGTAGPASEYNHGKVRIAENYYVQIGQETGWLGLGLLLAITVQLAYDLWRRRDQELAFGLFIALFGLVFINLLSHAWTDDTLAYLFWGLAGLALAERAVQPIAVKQQSKQA